MYRLLASKLQEFAAKHPDQDFGVTVAAVGEEVGVTVGSPAAAEPEAASAGSSSNAAVAENPSSSESGSTPAAPTEPPLLWLNAVPAFGLLHHL